MNQSQNTIPYLFRCPISLDLFEDPVTLCTGQTYDRSNIEKWLAAGNLTCPVTMQKLHDPTIVPNHTLRHLIDQWLQLGPQFESGNGNSATATIHHLSALKHTLESHDSSLENKLQALEKITALPDQYCSFNKSFFLQLDFLSLLLELVFGRSEAQVSKDQMHFIELAICCILKLLPLGNLEPLNMIKDESKLATFLLLFEKGTTLVKTSLCHLIESTSSSQTEELCSILGNSHKLVHEIVLAVYQNNKVSEDVIRGMSALCSLQSNRENLVRGGAIDGIMTYISERRQKNMAPVAMGIVEKLLEVESAKEELVNYPNGIKILVNMVFKVSDQECSDSAVGILLIICHDFEGAREEAIEYGVLTRLLLLLQSQCGATTKSKARMLLKLLRSKMD
ncbi:Zinc finger, RING/FYVE/PHD-type [Sesbania bispinosa]|nr:Zinc finger, RING/FYVE/PHD-type [Sesbania bispinosa]